MALIYNSRSETFKTPFGAVECGTHVNFTLHVPQEFGCTTPYLFILREGGYERQLLLEKQTDEDANAPEGMDVFVVSFWAGRAGLYFYYFDLYTGFRKLFCGEGNEAFISTENGPKWQLTVYEKGFTTPEALRGGIMYQIFPDRFYEGVSDKVMPFADRVYRTDKNGEPYFWPTEQARGWLNMDYFGGDFAGIRAKLPYLVNLGVTILYLNPIFEAHANHRYNTANYMQADSVLGTNEEFAALCASAKRRGISVILDGVFSHTGSDSVYFNREGRYVTRGAYHDLESPYRNWYDFSPNYACGYRSWWGFESLPEVNESDAGYRAFICGEGGVIDYWLGLGASGFRLDVADELPDDFIEDIRNAVKRHGDDKYLLGEVWEDATTKFSYDKRRSYLMGKGLDATMNYPFQTAVLEFLKGEDARRTAQRILSVCENYPAPALHVLMNFASTHDTVRAITALAGESCEGKDRYWQSTRILSPEAYERGRRLLTLAYAMLFTLPGIPSIYYGDEICMQGYKDPFNRAYFNWESPEKRLIPMLKWLARQRKRCRAFTDGNLHILKAEGGVLLYERRSGESVAIICINRTEHTVETQLLGKQVNVAPCDFAIETAEGTHGRNIMQTYLDNMKPFKN